MYLFWLTVDVSVHGCFDVRVTTDGLNGLWFHARHAQHSEITVAENVSRRAVQIDLSMGR